jgi:hypothetical protein
LSNRGIGFAFLLFAPIALFDCAHARAGRGDDADGAGGAARVRRWCATAPRFSNCVEGRLRRALYSLSGAAAARERHGTASSFRLGLFNATLR